MVNGVLVDRYAPKKVGVVAQLLVMDGLAAVAFGGLCLVGRRWHRDWASVRTRASGAPRAGVQAVGA